jgi:AcrR family transcriptional regulator
LDQATERNRFRKAGGGGVAGSKGKVLKNEIREFKRERILQEATKLFYERGFQGASIDAIAENLQVTKPFIYTYFDSKHALLESIYERTVQQLIAGVDEIFATERPPAEQLRRLVEFYVRLNIESREITSIYLNEERNLLPATLQKVHQQHREFDTKLSKLIKAGMRSGDFDIEDASLASLAISGMVRWVHRWYNPDGRMSAAQICKKMATLSLNLVGYSPPAVSAKLVKDEASRT